MVGWFKDLTLVERRTMLACFGGWSLDALDVQIFSFVIPSLLARLGHHRGPGRRSWPPSRCWSRRLAAGSPARLSDRFGRVRVLQVTILWYAVFTFLCGFAQDFKQLFILRALQGLGFGGEWAAGAVLMGEVIRDKYRGRGVGLVQTGWAVGWGAAALLYTVLIGQLPEACAWRVMFWIGLLPAALVFWIRRFVEEPDLIHAAAPRPTRHLAHLLGVEAALSVHHWRVSMMVAGAQGGSYALTHLAADLPEDRCGTSPRSAPAAT